MHAKLNRTAEIIPVASLQPIQPGDALVIVFDGRESGGYCVTASANGRKLMILFDGELGHVSLMPVVIDEYGNCTEFITEQPMRLRKMTKIDYVRSRP